jgi:hypothetical protein
MEPQTVFNPVIAGVVAGIVAALVAAYASRRNSERAIQIENITKERAKWRDKIRCLALEVQQAATEMNRVKLAELRLGFCLNLNPFDTEDDAIIAVISKFSWNKAVDEKNLTEFSDRLALLLKHDWERAKHEAKLFHFRRAPVRTPYEKFLTRSVEDAARLRFKNAALWGHLSKADNSRAT